MMVGLYACCAYLFKYHFAQLFQFIPCNFAYLFALPADALHILRNIQKICVFQRASAPRAPPGHRMACGGSPRRADPRVPDRTDGPTRRGSRGLLVPGRGSGAGRTDVRPAAPAPPPTAAPVPFFVFAATAAAVPGGLLAGKSRRAVHAGTLLPCSFLFRPSLLPRASGDPDRGGLVHRAVEPEVDAGARPPVLCFGAFPLSGKRPGNAAYSAGAESLRSGGIRSYTIFSGRTVSSNSGPVRYPRASTASRKVVPS